METRFVRSGNSARENMSPGKRPVYPLSQDREVDALDVVDERRVVLGTIHKGYPQKFWELGPPFTFACISVWLVRKIR